MKTIKEKIEDCIGKNVRVYFKSPMRRPVFGRFVIESDFEDFKRKGLFRFRSLSELETKTPSKVVDTEAVYDIVAYNYNDYESTKQ